MKKILLATALTLISAPALAQNISGEFSANVGLTTEYSFRGIDQNDEKMAVQGGFDYAYEHFYAGVWGSNVDFNAADDANLEVDLYAGFSGDYKGVSWDIGGIYYAYPGSNSGLDYDFYEAAVALGYDFDSFALSGSVNYSPDFFGGTGDAVYSAAYLDVPLPYDFSLSAHYGHQTIDQGTDYDDWSVGLGYSISGFDLGLKYVDTDLDEPTDCADGCEERVIFSISRSF